jgi:hypothetical protein
MVFRRFVGWLSGGKSLQDLIINLKLTDRRLERQKKKLKNMERQMLRETRAEIQQGNVENARTYATDAARYRRWAMGYSQLQSKINGLQFKLERAQAVGDLSKDLKWVIRSLRTINTQIKAPELGRTINELEGVLGETDISTEVMEDGLEGTMAADVEDVEVDKIMVELGAERSVHAETGLPSPDIRSKELQKEIEKLKED